MAELYWNSHKNVFSIREKGRVVGHTSNAFISSPEFVVSEAGRQRVLKEKVKNVHARIRGEVIQGPNPEASDQFYRDNSAFSDYSYAVYDPYDDCGCFRVLCVFGDILIRNKFADAINMVHATVRDDKPSLKVKIC